MTKKQPKEPPTIEEQLTTAKRDIGNLRVALAHEQNLNDRLIHELSVYRNVYAAARDWTKYWRDQVPPSVAGRRTTLLMEAVDRVERFKKNAGIGEEEDDGTDD